MSWNIQYRAPSRPQNEKKTYHIPPKLSCRDHFENKKENLKQYNPIKTNYSTNALLNNKDINDTKNEFEILYHHQLSNRWTDQKNNLKSWDYNIGDDIINDQEHYESPKNKKINIKELEKYI